MILPFIHIKLHTAKAGHFALGSEDINVNKDDSYNCGHKLKDNKIHKDNLIYKIQSSTNPVS